MLPIVTMRLDKIVGGGQALGALEDGRKVFVWGGLPGEVVNVQLTKKKKSYSEGYVAEVIEPSPDRVTPKDADSFLSTSPWQIMNLATENRYKEDLIKEAFQLHGVELSQPVEVYSDGNEYRYRNKVEFSWYGSTNEDEITQKLDLAFFKRGSKGKIIVNDSALLPASIVNLASKIRDFLQKKNVTARDLKTLLIRCNRAGECSWQLYIKTDTCDFMTEDEAASFNALGGEVIYSNPQSPASVITKRLLKVGQAELVDEILGTPFSYATESFFQVNIPVYEEALRDIKKWINPNTPVVDLYSGVGSIGLTVADGDLTLVELNPAAVAEMKRNIKLLGKNAHPVLAASEDALDYITVDATIIVDPPRVGLHSEVVDRILEQKPARVVYLSCNPVTQARDVALLLSTYDIKACRGYNFFPHTPHIEHLLILDLK